MRVVLTEQAIGNLLQIARYIYQDNPTRAKTFVAELRIDALDWRRRPTPIRSSQVESTAASVAACTVTILFSIASIHKTI